MKKNKIIRKRKPIYVPEFKPELEGWTVNQLANKWKPWQYSPYYEYDDVLQEARLLFLKLKGRYTVVNNPSWFTSLFKTSFTRFMIDATRHNRRQSARYLPLQTEANMDCDWFTDVVGDTDNAGLLSAHCKQAPADVRAVLRYIAVYPQALLADGPTKRQRRDNSNSVINAALGFESGDILGKVQNYLASAV